METFDIATFSAKHIGVCPLEFAGTGSAQNKSQLFIFDKPVNFIKDLRYFLDFIEDDRSF